MNNVYRLVWNKTTQSWQVVSELAKGNIKSSRNTDPLVGGLVQASKALLCMGMLTFSAAALAAPTGGVVSTGTASISSSGSTTTINQSTARAAIDWSSFSTASNETVNFVQPSSSSITLNRVTGTSASTLNGNINATGQVFIVNPNGVLFNATSQVNASGLVASTLNITNTDFTNGNFKFANSNNTKTVENKGSITTSGTGGTVALLAPTVKQSGTITTPEGSVLLAAGGDITLSLNNNSLLSYTINQGKAQALINSAGTIKANGGKVILTAKGLNALSTAVVNSAGVIEAKTVNNKRGVIELGADLTSGTLNVAGTLDASAPTTGNGGLIKTSASQVHISNGTNISTQRVNQTALPPTTSGWELSANNVDVEFLGGSLSSSTLSDALSKGNVSLNAFGTATTEGHVNINDAVNWDANTALTLTANKDINFNSDVSLTADKAKLAINYGVSHDYNLNNGAKITISGATPTLLINGVAYTVINSLGEEGDASTTTLQGIQNNLTGNYALGANIDASDTVNWNNGAGFSPIGQVQYQTNTSQPYLNEVGGIAFSGKFHGLGHLIENLTINQPVGLPKPFPENGEIKTPVGLFSTSNGTLRDISLFNANITGDSYVGALVGINKNGNISNSHSSGSVIGNTGIGGLAGYSGFRYNDTTISTGKIFGSSSSVNVKGLGGVGGLVGVSANPIYSSFASGDVALRDISLSLVEEQNLNSNNFFGAWGGGLVGIGNGIYNSYATGNVLKGINVNGNLHDDIGFIGSGGLVGALASYSTNHFIDNSYATGNVDGLVTLGGLVGWVVPSNGNQNRVAIQNSYSSGNTSGTDEIGGLVGGNSPNHIITTSYSTGNVNGKDMVGGLVGSNFGKVNNSYSLSNTTGNSKVGGLVGTNGYDSYTSGIIENSYSVGQVFGTGSNIGGLVGYQSSGSTTTNSYWDIDTSGTSSSDAGIGRTTAELKQINTFNGWDIADISDPNSTSLWVIDEENSSPTLRYNP